MNRKTILIFLLALTLIFSSCASSEHSSDKMLADLLAVSGEEFEGNGYMFMSSASETDIGYLSDEYKNMLYTEQAAASYFPKIEEFAIFVFTRAPGEIAVFKCYSSSDTDAVVKMCLERADSIKVVLRGSEWEEKSKNILISVSGRWVIFSFCEDAQNVEELFWALT